MTSLLDAALSYARRGWPVIPLHTFHGFCSCGKPECAAAGKHPRIKAWQREATTDPATVLKWWKAWPDANIGLAAGQRAGWWVLDVDAGRGGEESLAELERKHGKLPDTVQSLTGGGGRHLFFAWPSQPWVGEVRNRANVGGWQGLDVRGEGGYVVAPPSMHASGWEYSWELSSDPADGVAIAEAPPWLLELVRDGHQETPSAAAEPLGDVIPEGGRNAALTSLAGSMRRRGASEAAILAALAAENAARCVPPLPEDELRRIASSVGRYQPEALPELPPGPPTRVENMPAHRAASPAAEEKPEPPHLTDLGNARRLVALHGRDLHYCYPWGRWLVWDGRRWALDMSGAAERLAKATVQAIYEEASKTADDERRKALAKHALKSEGQRAISAILALAQSEPGIPVQPAELDANPWLLNVLNGTLDLRTGELREHRREDLLTKLAPVEYDATARLELWERFLAESTRGDQELATFLQRAAGYSLTGETDEEKLFFVHGPAAAGKSTFLEALKAALGDYAATADFETFLARTQVGGPRSDVAALAGARLVVGIEVDEGKRMAEGLVKQLTGGDTVTARFLYKENFTFRPQFKLWLAANHAPKVSDADDAMWRRILRVPFEQVVPLERRDPEVKRVLRDPAQAGPALLAWAVQGCLAWQREGLGIPPAVVQATDAYRLDNDPLREFVRIRCVFGPTRTVRISQLRETYSDWAKENGERPIGNRDFNRRLELRGCHREHTRSGDVWVGIGLVIPGDGEECEQSEHGISKVELVSDSRGGLLNQCSQRSLFSQGNGKDPAKPSDDPTDRGVWEPPADVKRMIEEVFGSEAPQQ